LRTEMKSSVSVGADEELVSELRVDPPGFGLADMRSANSRPGAGKGDELDAVKGNAVTTLMRDLKYPRRPIRVHVQHLQIATESPGQIHDRVPVSAEEEINA
jgi:hypothetical protein